MIIGNRLNGSTPHDLALYAPLTEDEGPEPPRTCGDCEWCETIGISEFTIYWWLREYGEKGCEKRVYERLASEL